MKTEIQECPCCGSKIRNGAFSKNSIFDPIKNSLINEYHDTYSEFRCSKCGDAHYDNNIHAYSSELSSLRRDLKNYIDTIPLASIHSPLNWEYTVIGLVSAQSTTGTGIFSDIASSYTDFFGEQSQAYNQKLASGESICKTMLRKSAVELGGNAVVAIDIDYAEVGKNTGMLMVCMTGTAIKLSNPTIVGGDFSERFSQIIKIYSRLQELENFSELTTYQPI